MKRSFRVTTRLLSLIALLSLLTLSLVSCGYKPIEPTEDEARVVGTVGEYEVLWDELRFVSITYQNILKSKYGEDVFEGEDAEKYKDELRELVYKNITSNYAVLTLCAEVGIKQGEDEIIAAVDAELEATVKELGGVRKYKNYLKENALSDRLFRFTAEIRLLENELFYVYTDDINIIKSDYEDVYDIIMDEFIHVRHIFIPHTENDASLLIEEAYEKLESGEEFVSVMSDYNRDSDMSDSGKVILKGYMSEEYDATAFYLRKNKYSDIFEDANGYYIVQRIDLSPATVMSQFNYLSDLYQTYTLFALIDEQQELLTFVPNSLADSTDLSMIK